MINRGTPEAYRGFLGLYPDGRYHQEAKAFLAKVAEERAWQAALATNQVQALLDFEAQFPQSAHVASNEVDDRINALEEDQLWREATRSNTVSGYREYLRRTRLGKYGMEARDAMAGFRQIDEEGQRWEQEKQVAEAREAGLRQEAEEARQKEAEEKVREEAERLKKKQESIPQKKKPSGVVPSARTAPLFWNRHKRLIYIGLAIVPGIIFVLLLVKIIPSKQSDSLFSPQMVLVEGGTFTMGCTDEQVGDCNDDEKPAHQVTVSNFQIGKYEVTQAEWKAVMGNNPSEFKNCDHCPVHLVSWNDVQEFIKKLNQKTGKNYRLPTEAEWEYAARGGQKSNKTEFAGSQNLDAVGWYDHNSDSKPHPVGGKAPNELGIYDMSGNVWEWCADWYGAVFFGIADESERTWFRKFPCVAGRFLEQ